MFRLRPQIALVLTAAFLFQSLLTGCRSLSGDPEETLSGLDPSSSNKVTPAAPRTPMPTEEIEKVDLLSQLDPEGKRFDLLVRAHTQYGKFQATLSGGSAETSSGDNARHDFTDPRTELAMALRAFNESEPTTTVARRNQIQDLVMMSANHQCYLYKLYLQRNQTVVNFYSGAIGTILGGLGAIFTNEDVARALAGAAGITSGLRAEFNQQYYSNLATNVIMAGIELRRKEISEEIRAKRETAKDIRDYTIEAALGDAVQYHSACSIVSGLEYAKDSIERVDNPGLREISKVANLVKFTRDALDPDKGAVAVPARPDLVTSAGALGIASQSQGGASSTPAAELVQAERRVVSAYAELAEAITKTKPVKSAILAGDASLAAALSQVDALVVPARDQVKTLIGQLKSCDATKKLTVGIIEARTLVDTAESGESKAQAVAKLQEILARADQIVGIPLKSLENRAITAANDARRFILSLDAKSVAQTTASLTGSVTALQQVKTAAVPACP